MNMRIETYLKMETEFKIIFIFVLNKVIKIDLFLPTGQLKLTVTPEKGLLYIQSKYNNPFLGLLRSVVDNRYRFFLVCSEIFKKMYFFTFYTLMLIFSLYSL